MAFDAKALRDSDSPSARRGNAAMRHGTVLTPAEVARILAVAERGPLGLRNSALILALLGTGLGAEGVRQLRVRHFLNADGTVRPQVVVREDACSPPAVVYWSNARVVTRLQTYLATRAAAAGNPRSSFRGLDPDAPLFPAREEAAAGDLESGITRKWLSALLCTLFEQAGVHASPSRSARLTLAHRMLAGGARESDVARVLGCSRELLRRVRRAAPRKTIEEALAAVV